jgi:hypothetical protein
MEKGEKPFTPVVSKNQRKKIKQLIMSQGRVFSREMKTGDKITVHRP